MIPIVNIAAVIDHTTCATACVPHHVLVYSHNRETREKITRGLGRVPDTEIAPVDFVDTATPAALLEHMASGRIDVAILDGEAIPAGGIGAAKQIKDELLQCPPIAVLIARPADVWLARWSGADAVLTHPVEPIVLNRAVVSLLRTGPFDLTVVDNATESGMEKRAD